MSWILPIRSKPFTGIDIGQSSVRLAAVSLQKNKWVLHAADKIDYEPSSLLNTLDTYLSSRDNKIPAASFSPPLHHTSFTNLRVPVLPPYDQLGLVRYETARKLNQHADQLLIDYSVYDSQAPTKTKFHKVLSFACSKTYIDNIVECLQKYKIRVPVVDAMPMAYLNALFTLQPDLQKNTFIGIDSSPNHLLLTIADQGCIVFTRKILLNNEISDTETKDSILNVDQLEIEI